MKKLFLYPHVGFVCVCSFLLLFVYSCKKDIQEKEKQAIQEEFPTGSPGGGGTDFCMDPLENYNNNYDSIEYQTILGNQLVGNPYSVSVMQQASVNLYGHSHGISVNKKYIRLRPADEDQMTQLLDLDLELFDYPLTYEVILEGDYYEHPGVGPNEDSWFYTVVDPGFQPPAGITYEWLADLYVPDQDLWLEEEALRITGNPTTDTCNSAMYRVPFPCTIPSDPNCDTTSTGGGGGNPLNTMIPAGTIEVWDSNRGDRVPVRRVKVVVRRWFKIDPVYTDDLGRFQGTKRFRNRVNVFVKFLNQHLRTSGFVSNIGLVGSRIQRALMPIKRGIGTFSGNLTRINHLFESGTNTARRLYRHWWAAQLMNTYLEYNEHATNQGIGLLPTQKMRIILTRWSFMRGSGATPMNSHRTFNGLPSGDYFAFYFTDPVSYSGAFWYNALMNGWLFRWVDMGLGYHTQDVWASNRVKDLMFHEFTHAAHFNKVGDNYWHDFVFAESFTLSANGYLGDNAPYGLGTDGAISDIISVGESWAEHVAQVFSDIQYRNFPSEKFNIQGVYRNNQPVVGLSSHLNAIEDFNPNFANNPFRWIPEGLYYDMFDVRNEFFPVQDNVLDYTNQQFFNALDNDVRSIPQFRIRLLAENGNNQAVQVTDLFGRYNY